MGVRKDTLKISCPGPLQFPWDKDPELSRWMSNSPAVWILAWGQVENWSQGSAGIKSQQGETTDVFVFPRKRLGPKNRLQVHQIQTKNQNRKVDP